MKLKFANSLLVAALVVTAAGCFTSCKDTDEDMYNTLESQYLTLADKLASDQSDISALQSALTALQGRVSALENQATPESCTCDKAAIAQALEDIKDLQSDIANCATVAQFTQVEQEIAELQSKVQSILDNLPGDVDLSDYATKAEVQAVQDAVDALSPVVTQNQKDIAELQGQMEYAIIRLQNDSTELANLNSAVSDLNSTVSDLTDSIAAVNDKLTQLREYTEAVNTLAAEAKEEADSALNEIVDIKANIADLEARVSTLEKEYETLNNTVSELSEKIDALTETVNGILSDVLNLQSIVDNRINAITVSQVMNPVIGSVSLPVDVSTMLLFNYWGLNENNISGVFPNFDYNTSNFYGLRPDDGVLLSSEQQSLLGTISTITEAQGQDFVGDNGKLGTLYFSVNPMNVDLTSSDYSFSLINSLGEASPIELSQPAESDHLITFGNSRSSDVALWESTATLGASDIYTARISVEDGLASAVKGLISERTIASGVEVLAKVYNTITNNSSLPAYGLKAEWTDSLGNEASAVSQYNIAAVTYRPLSYSLFYGQSLASKLPTIPSMDTLIDYLNFDFGTIELTFDLPTITVGNVTLDSIKLTTKFDDASSTITVDYTYYQFRSVLDQAGDTIVEIETPYTGTTTQVSGAITESDVAALVQNIEDTINASIIGWQVELDALTESINSQINEIVESITEQVNSELNTVISNLQNTVNGTVQSVLSKFGTYYDSVANLLNRVIAVLDDPNYYMQISMLYATNNVAGRLSTSSALPSVWQSSSSSTGYATLVATNYNVEAITPAYKKYVAVTNVWKADDSSVSAVNGDSTCKSLLETANAGEYMNEVIEGNRQLIAFDFHNAVGGDYVYEIFYQAIDYRGNYSTRKYYVRVK